MASYVPQPSNPGGGNGLRSMQAMLGGRRPTPGGMQPINPGGPPKGMVPTGPPKSSIPGVPPRPPVMGNPGMPPRPNPGMQPNPYSRPSMTPQLLADMARRRLGG